MRPIPFWYEDEDERESEFTGLKGYLLRYAGSAWLLFVISAMFHAAADIVPAAAAALLPLSFACAVAGFAAWPLVTVGRHLITGESLY